MAAVHERTSTEALKILLSRNAASKSRSSKRLMSVEVEPWEVEASLGSN